MTSGRWQDALFERTTLFFALLVCSLLAAIIVSLVYGACPRSRSSASAFFVTDDWDPVTEQFGALAPIYGTLVTSGIALLIGMPVSFGIALFLTEMCRVAQASARHRGRAARRDSQHHLRHVGPVRLRAAVRRLRAAVADRDARRTCRCSAPLFQGPPNGIGMLTAGIILAIMVIPFIAVGDARRVRDRAAGAEGVGVRPRLHDLGSRVATSCCRTPRSASSAASCWASAARSAKPWR